MPTDTAHGRTSAGRFALAGVAWSLGFFGLLRLNWTEAAIVLPFTHAQGALAAGLFGVSALPVDVTLACSGADVLAVCLGAVLAYPVPWRTRLAGAVGGAALILGLNIVRIGTLGRVAAWPRGFIALHVYLWPALLVLAIAGYVFGWMRLADRQPEAERPNDGDAAAAALVVGRVRPTRRFVGLVVAFLILFTAASPLYLRSTAVLAIAGFIAGAAAAILGGFGVDAHATANVLFTSRGAFLVTQECISTPLIPIYLAGIGAYAATWRWRVVAGLATLPLFVALGIARLLVVALPVAVVASPLFFVHAFYQLLLGAVVVLLAAFWRHGGKAAWSRTMIALLVGAAFAYLAGPFYTRVVTYPAGVPLADAQGAIALLPAFQVGLYLALWVAAYVAVGWPRFFTGLAVLGLSQTIGLLALRAAADHAGLTARVSDVRGWAVAGPLLVVLAVVNGVRPRH